MAAPTSTVPARTHARTHARDVRVWTLADLARAAARLGVRNPTWLARQLPLFPGRPK